MTFAEPDTDQPDTWGSTPAWGAPEPAVTADKAPAPAKTRRRRSNTADKPSETPRRRRKTNGSQIDTEQTRHVIDRTLAVATLDEEETGLLASACGTPGVTDPADITLASLVSHTQATDALNLLLDVAGADPISAGALAAGAAADGNLAGAWEIVARLSPDLPLSAPAKAAEAGVAYAGAAQGLDTQILDRVRAVLALLDTGF